MDEVLRVEACRVNTARWRSLWSVTGPLRGGHDADVAHAEQEFDAPALNNSPRIPLGVSGGSHGVC
ncbi:hypothetical protein EYF80_068228 [Liparis tanakae]|uniref:Uncharacterized protein n=1 Tax=Liparis tanakae TaxID=230148 RepID=A0A4Z2DZI6_9TELE|nr:hypothetical protein EYF80_068228 [Liparis tanakae]